MNSFEFDTIEAVLTAVAVVGFVAACVSVITGVLPVEGFLQ